MIDIKAMQQKYGKPTLSDAVNAYYILAALYEMAEKVEFMHNFQLERSDIVDYVYKTHPIIKVLKGYE